MTTREYIEKKNALVFKVTEKILVPESQIVDLPKVRLAPSEYLTCCNCPYCVTWTGCEDCVMYKSGNDCGEDDSTYNICNNLWRTLATQADRYAMKALVREYNKSIA